MKAEAFQKEGKTLLVNPGPAAHGSYALITIEKSIDGWIATATLKSLG